ncbi:S8 family serine peptidase [Streptomyces sp. VRA16 Mangrove soil]|uniref:S8 family serine peptidase n=1 Tax=Streptomyces sp. VRA16 Mangrove soil TaxID=2817434 RepID=UPI001A9F82F3|nr:S8 family serine peptidase [Streptomyces sp. VRA16 Mangrove soil]MBO1335304.1 S8 family serine peptidase [Streptomyces sp. VRA16 Mangrove soil]
MTDTNGESQLTSHRSGRGPRLRGLLAAALAATVGVPALAVLPAAAQPIPSTPSALAAKAETRVVEQLQKKDRATFWVQLADRADTTAARKSTTKAGRGRSVLKAKTAYADKTQAGLKALLKKSGARYASYWISDTIKVTGADKALADKIAARADVVAIQSDDPIELPDPIEGTQEATVDGVEWNVDRIGATKVWDTYQDRGEGIVVASIDTGVDHKHPTLSGSYRGRKADGTYDHAYNWFDPTGNCDRAGVTGPCDDNGHGTHTMGTMVGDDGAGNRIGVAPGATWIAAKGCGTADCTRADLLAAGQWLLAPTDEDGQNPRPDLAPDVINNSWGAAVLDQWYEATVQAWRDAGIFPAFSNGNDGPSCDTAGSPGAYANTYSSGAIDANNRIASFSSRGTGSDDGIKPNIAAPGVNIRSAAPNGKYQYLSGTSMASPHTAAAVALIWSAAPALRGDVTATEALLNRTAIDTDDTSCGGTAANNNVYGEGRLDAYAAVTGAPRDHLGALHGAVTSGGDAAADAQVTVDGPVHATVRTDKDGAYTFPRLTAGEYKVTAEKFGYTTDTATLTVTEGATADHDVALALAPTGKVTGTVTSASGREADVAFKVQGTPVRATSGADGGYTITLPVGSYDIQVQPLDHCAAATSLSVDVTRDGLTKDLDLASRTDGAGTTCRVTADEAFPTGDTSLGIDESSTGAGYRKVDLPFPVALYGRTYTQAWISHDGMLTFGYPNLTGANTALPSTAAPNGSLYPFWDNLLVDQDSEVYWAVRGTAPHREYVVEWRDMLIARDAPNQRITFSAVMGEDGTYSFHYKDIDATERGDEKGAGATIGAENHEGTTAFQYALNQTSVRDGMAIDFSPAGYAVASGKVTDGNDGKPVTGATVTLTKAGTKVGTAVPGADGSYLIQIPVTGSADYQVTIAAPHYETVTRTQTLQGLSVLYTPAALPTGAVTADDPDGWKLVVPVGQTCERTLTLSNAGSAADYTVKEKSGKTWISASPAAGRLDAQGEQKITLTFDTTKATSGTVLTGTLVITTESGRAPVTELPLTVVVPAYRAALDAGQDTDPVTDPSGDTWNPDRAHTDGSYGFLGDGTETVTTSKTVTGTDTPKLFGTARLGAAGYRFDHLPNGTYQVELGFAELSGTKPGRRVFSVTAEGAEKVSNIDIALEAGGGYKALTKTFTVKVTDGQLDLGFTPVTGKPLVNSVRVTQRPDLG